MSRKHKRDTNIKETKDKNRKGERRVRGERERIGVRSGEGEFDRSKSRSRDHLRWSWESFEFDEAVLNVEKLENGDQKMI